MKTLREVIWEDSRSGWSIFDVLAVFGDYILTSPEAQPKLKPLPEGHWEKDSSCFICDSDHITVYKCEKPLLETNMYWNCPNCLSRHGYDVSSAPKEEPSEPLKPEAWAEVKTRCGRLGLSRSIVDDIARDYESAWPELKRRMEEMIYKITDAALADVKGCDIPNAIARERKRLVGALEDTISAQARLWDEGNARQALYVLKRKLEGGEG